VHLRKLIASTLCASSIAAIAAASAAPVTAPPLVRPDRIELPSADGKSLSGLLHAVVDKRGRLRLLADRDLRIYALQEGRWRQIEQLRTSKHDVPIVRTVAMSPDGDTWMLTQPGDPELLYFVRGEEKSLPDVGWTVMAVGLPGGTPSVAIAPFATQRAKAEAFGDGPVPLVLRLEGDEWVPFAQRSLEPPVTRDHELGSHQMRDYSDVFLANGANGSLWLAQKNAYVVREYASSGKLRVDIGTEKPTVEYRDRTTAEQQKFQGAMKGRPAAEVKRWEEGISRQVPKQVIQGVAASDGSHAFVLRQSRDGSGLELDRYDGVLQRAQRTRVEIPRFSWARSFVATSDGLVVVSASFNDEVWLFPWERLETAAWQPLREARIRPTAR